jgi:protein-glutamine gamma-glutamyltransferase
MITISGSSVQPYDIYNQWLPSVLEKMIIEKMAKSQTVYEYDSLNVLKFELVLRMEMISSARELNQSKVSFATFDRSRCNPDYWEMYDTGVFKLKTGVQPSTGIRDIFVNGSKYAFECATAMVIVFYKAVLDSTGEKAFNELFANMYLFSWHYDPDLGLKSYNPSDYFPGDVRYFKNPDVNPETPQWQGENVVILEDGTYYGHGIGIKTADQLISILNKQRKPGAIQSAYLMDQVTRPDFKKLAQFAGLQHLQTNRTDQKNQIGKELLLYDKAYFKESNSFEEYLSIQNSLKKRCIIIRIGGKTFKRQRD